MQASFLAALLMAALAGTGGLYGSGSAAEAAASTSLPGSPAAGKAIFDGSGNCLSCHRVGARGAVVGPNLSNAGSRLTAEALTPSLLKPPVTAAPQDRLYQIVLRGGKTVRGKLLNQDPFSVQMLDAQGQLVAFSRAEIRDAHFVDAPSMPSYQGKLTSTQLADLVAYLASLRAPQN